MAKPRIAVILSMSLIAGPIPRVCGCGDFVYRDRSESACHTTAVACCHQNTERASCCHGSACSSCPYCGSDGVCGALGSHHCECSSSRGTENNQATPSSEHPGNDDFLTRHLFSAVPNPAHDSAGAGRMISDLVIGSDRFLLWPQPLPTYLLDHSIRC